MIMTVTVKIHGNETHKNHVLVVKSCYPQQCFQVTRAHNQQNMSILLVLVLPEIVLIDPEVSLLPMVHNFQALTN